MKCNKVALSLFWLILMTGLNPQDITGQVLALDRSEYADRLRGMWLGECIANWTGLQTEGDRTSPPFYTDSNWSSFGFILDQDPWLADDDTDIEYVYVHLLDEHSLTTLTPSQIRNGWMAHINNYIWVSNARVRGMMEAGVLPPATSLLAANDLAIMIDAQLTTEVFGALAPGMVNKALRMANIPILTTANSHAAHASQFHVILYALASSLDTQLSGRDQALWLIDEASMYFPASSKIIDIVNFVRTDFLANPDMDDWEFTRDNIYDRYQLHASENGFQYASWVESSINFATGIMALLYGEMDYRKTVRVGSLSGWDSDNPTATMGGLLGLIYGYDQLALEFSEEVDFSERYNIYRTRDALPDYLPEDSDAEDTFTLMADRMLGLIDLAVVEGGGTVQDSVWLLPYEDEADVELNPLYGFMQGSANYTVQSDGGSVTASSSAGGSAISAIADGFEHDFSGAEWYGETEEYLSNYSDSATVSVVYDRLVLVHTVRLIEGELGGGFTSAEIEIQQDGSWLSPAGDVLPLALIDADQGLQIIDFELLTPVEARGIRISGAVSGRLNILELDALSEPWIEDFNVPPIISIISPEMGAWFEAPADISIDVEAYDLDGIISRVEFIADGELLGTDMSSPYSMIWNNVPLGTHQFSVTAIDDGGETTSSETRWIIVGESVAGDSLIWHSYEVNTNANNLPLLIYDHANTTSAALELYQSTVSEGVAVGNLFTSYNSGQHSEGFNHVEDFWANSSGNDAYPYIGKSTVDRGSDSGESNAPFPQGVRDLQFHPPDNSYMTVAAFVVPFEGYYSVSDLAVRRVSPDGYQVQYKVFNSSQALIANLTATNNRSWVTNDNTFYLDELSTGDRIYFAVDRGAGDNFYWDATEVSWTITYTADSMDYYSQIAVPIEYILKQNYPNPFNPSTTLKYEIPQAVQISLVIYDLQGKVISTMDTGLKPAGYYELEWHGLDDSGNPVSTGVYFCRLQAGEYTKTIKLVYLK